MPIGQKPLRLKRIRLKSMLKAFDSSRVAPECAACAAMSLRGIMPSGIAQPHSFAWMPDDVLVQHVLSLQLSLLSPCRTAPPVRLCSTTENAKKLVTFVFQQPTFCSSE